jgi:hypothetical protein
MAFWLSDARWADAQRTVGGRFNERLANARRRLSGLLPRCRGDSNSTRPYAPCRQAEHKGSQKDEERNEMVDHVPEESRILGSGWMLQSVGPKHREPEPYDKAGQGSHGDRRKAL